jgi:glucoamylase
MEIIVDNPTLYDLYLHGYDAFHRFLSQVAMRFTLLSTIGLWASSIVAFSSVDEYIATESPIAKAGMLANIGPSGSKSSGAAAGIVIASPNTVNPNYLYTWIRDSSLVFKTLIDQYTSGQDKSLRGLIDEFIVAQAGIQHVSNPSGDFATGGLGEPKFLISGQAYTDPWGRPQRDGPALRSTALITYANWLLANGNSSYVTNTLWPIVESDLNYVTVYWNQTTFDLWEEVSSASYWTTAVQHRALRQGASLASSIGQSLIASTFSTQADNILCFMQTFWNPTGSYMTSNTGGGRSGIDANTALASIHTFDHAAGCDPVTFQPCSDKALSSLKVYVDSFRSIYAINGGVPSNEAVATGRYAEDVYQGGNPWYLTTAAVSEQLYDALHVWDAEGSLNVTTTSLAFFKQFSSSITPGTYDKGSSTYDTLMSAIHSFADGFLAIHAKYTPSDGGLAEQYSRSNGAPLSAVDLTWSYAAALTMFAARNGTVQDSWGAKGLTVPSSCQSYSGPTVPVMFNVHVETQWGQNIFLTGSVNELKNWSPSNAIPLSAANYPIWSVTVDVPASTYIQYKYISIFNGQVTWESDPNNKITTPISGNTSTNDSWR